MKATIFLISKKDRKLPQINVKKITIHSIKTTEYKFGVNERCITSLFHNARIKKKINAFPFLFNVNEKIC